MQQMGRRSEPVEHPFRAMPPDEGAPDYAPGWLQPAVVTFGRPVILIERVGQRDVVTAACPLALDLGLRPGMAAAHARALVTDLDVRDAEGEKDRALLDRLALHAIGRWTPTASVAAPDGLWLDLTGTTHLFGGEQRFCRRLLAFLRRLGFTATIAIAGTPGAAHALARYGGDAITVLPPGAETRAIAELPLAALRLAPEALTAAARFGLERVADLYPMPRGPLARRLGVATVQRLDQARGAVAEPIVPVVPFEEPHVARRLLEPIGTAEAITQVIGDLVDDMVGLLQARGLGLRAAVLTCVRVDGEAQHIGLGTARATRDAKHLKRMLGMRVERIEPGLGIEAMALAAPRVEDLFPHALGARLGGETQASDLAPLVDQLAGRVGDAALFRVGSQESDVPERAACRADALACPTGWPAWKRPARLLRRPELLGQVVALLPDHPPRRFVWRGKRYRVVAGDGPERIHGEWWRKPQEMWAIRDYFRVEAEGGERFWLFRRGDGVDAPTGDLSWYMHGLFG
ncbi:DNA polymerase Y family protein [Sphingobium sp. TKS]|uniref:DNA polymerase Y family protein n=2 Tax=Sphingomonadaceae TaxID=41297 RepID=UPI000B0FBB17|nr:DNA polymerase Y family protein [Sphingobium sp. TKS]MCF8707618.1 DNA polymerase Y family protein [Rhizorhapis sp. SPR117]